MASRPAGEARVPAPTDYRDGPGRSRASPSCRSTVHLSAPRTYPRAVVGDRIYDENLRFFIEALAHFAGATFDDDWAGLEHDLVVRRDHLDQERHVEWPLGNLQLDLFYEPGGSAVSFRLAADAELELRGDTLV